MANELAHQINNPLQSLTNLVFVAKQNEGLGEARSLALKLDPELTRLSALVRNLLDLPKRTSQAG